MFFFKVRKRYRKIKNLEHLTLLNHGVKRYGQFHMGQKYSRMNQVKFVGDSLQKFYLAHSWILCPICPIFNLCWHNYKRFFTLKVNIFIFIFVPTLKLRIIINILLNDWPEIILLTAHTTKKWVAFAW